MHLTLSLAQLRITIGGGAILAWAGIRIIIKTLYSPSPIRVRRMGEGREGGQYPRQVSMDIFVRIPERSEKPILRGETFFYGTYRPEESSFMDDRLEKDGRSAVACAERRWANLSLAYS